MSAGAADQTAAVRGVARIADSPGLVIGAGALSILIGVLVLGWPGATIVVIAWLFAVQLIVAGVLQLVSAFSAGRGPGGRMLSVLLGALSILVGLLCLRATLQTALVLGLVIGALWVLQGIAGVVDALGSDQGPGRGWAIASGVLSVLGGAVVLVYPGTSLVVLTWLFGIVLVVVGVPLVVQGIATRRAGTPRPSRQQRARAGVEAGGEKGRTGL
ncbi:HdeD family acid-resistance protein [Pseudonocardia adelaidensis]|uniref:HdeD family acid-resistance protein n=1 Tax=Pseudonocardia adelaidensis TaxID=648754 RepID=A0ABP9NAZ2_9PSEU